MPVPPAELSAHLKIAGDPQAVEAVHRVADPAGIALEGGPHELLLSGRRALVLATLDDVIAAALDNGAYRIDVRLEAPTESRR